jgi:hypothetical protein
MVVIWNTSGSYSAPKPLIGLSLNAIEIDSKPLPMGFVLKNPFSIKTIFLRIQTTFLKFDFI